LNESRARLIQMEPSPGPMYHFCTTGMGLVLRRCYELGQLFDLSSLELSRALYSFVVLALAWSGQQGISGAAFQSNRNSFAQSVSGCSELAWQLVTSRGPSSSTAL
jgi:hypothetical protein